MNEKLTSWHLHINGIVQGVGYRPYVDLVASELMIKGTVRNDVDGLHVIFNATRLTAQNFTDRITKDSPPPLAQITSIELIQIPYIEFSKFEIVHESYIAEPNLIITPDFALCNACQQDLTNPNERRHRYPFISCSQCGPRYSIISELPYDRENTEMNPFEMCTSCSDEYHDKTDRRFYAQTNSCPNCAVQLSLFDSSGTLISGDANEILDLVPQLWREGRIVAIKGIGGYLLTCAAEKTSSVLELRRRKHRTSKPLAVMFPNIEFLTKFQLGPKATVMLQNHIAPIVLIPIDDENRIEGVCADHDHIGVMLPYTPILKILLEEFAQPTIATSANISNAPIVFQDNEEMFQELGIISDYILSNNRNIVVPQDDSVLKYTTHVKKKIILRRSRGFAPAYINPDLAWSEQSILSTGAQLKSTFSLLQKGHVYISQYLGDLDNFDTKSNYNFTLDHLIKLTQVKPEIVLSDKHKQYDSTILGEELARRKNIPIFYIQHHEAHFSAVLGEHNLLDVPDPILGVIWDGAGLGDDDCIWGSEFFIYNESRFRRCNHLSYFDLLLGDKMAKEPRLAALSLTFPLKDACELLDKKFSSTELRLYTQMLSNGKQVQTSSMGRLFDAVASILGLMDKQTFEGEAAMKLEMSASQYVKKLGIESIKEYYQTNFTNDVLSSNELIRHVIVDLLKDLGIGRIAAKFHLTLVKWIEAIATVQGCKKIAFSGGVFQNSLLVDLTIENLGCEFDLYFHEQLSPNDENISFGQLIYHQIVNNQVKKG